jgi:hypothetical protein
MLQLLDVICALNATLQIILCCKKAAAAVIEGGNRHLYFKKAAAAAAGSCGGVGLPYVHFKVQF